MEFGNLEEKSEGVVGHLMIIGFMTTAGCSVPVSRPHKPAMNGQQLPDFVGANN